MGSPLRLTVAVGQRRESAGDPQRAWTAVVDEFEAAEAALSRFRAASDLTELNRVAGTGRVVEPSRRLRRALAAADRAHRSTEGRFDPRVLADLDRLGYRGAPIGDVAAGGARNGMPSSSVAHDPAGRVCRRVSRRSIALDRPVDLGGIGKGLTLRWAASILEREGWRDFLLEAGGDLVTRGRTPDGGAWRVGVEDPFMSGPPIAVVEADDMALATSSVRVHRWIVDGRIVHHLLDPRTGEPADSGLVSVTVAAPDPAWAEVWSKVLFIGGRAAIATEARARGLAAWWVVAGGSVEMTPAARARTAWLAGEAGAIA